MASKSPTELIRELQLELTKLIAEANGLREEVRRAELLNTRDRLIKLESTLEAVDVPEILVQLGVIQEQISELRKWREELEKKRWQVVILFGGCLLTLLVQLALLTIKK